MAEQHRAGFAEVHGARLYYEVVGEGHPLVLIHAGVADHRMWDDQFEVFARHYQVVRYDARGYGKSVTDDGGFSDRQDLSDLLEHLRLATAHVLGVSRGGQIAMDFTLERPGKVSALVMVASGPGGYKSPHPNPEVETMMFQETDSAWKAKDFARLADLGVRLWVDGPGQPADRVPSTIRERVREMILNNSRTHTIEGKPQPLTPPAVGRLAEIRVPTLIVTGDLDTSHIRSAADFMEQNIRRAKKLILPRTAHMLNMERPDAFNRIVLEFLGSVE